VGRSLFLIGRRPKRLISGPKLYGWAAEKTGIPFWLFNECYDAVADVAETIALVLCATSPCAQGEAGGGVHSSAENTSNSGEMAQSQSLAYWVEHRLLPLAGMSDEEQRDALFAAWKELDQVGIFVFTKLITGGFRVGVSQDLVIRALAQTSEVPAATVAHRLMGAWEPTGEFFQALVGPEDSGTDLSKPYPFCLAHPLQEAPEDLGDITDWYAEWKFDGIRAQLIRRAGHTFTWSRGEDLITSRFPEIAAACEFLPDGTVLDGEILAWGDGKPLRFLELQRRIGRKVLSKKVLSEVPVVVVVFDLLELEGQDWRERPLAERRAALERVVADTNRAIVGKSLFSGGYPVDARLASTGISMGDGTNLVQTSLLVSQPVRVASWTELLAVRADARSLTAEGLMLKRLDSPYVVGRKKGFWWKWKIEPLTVDAVLIYANRGNGIRASLYTDYTFGVWDDGKLVPLAKAYSGLTDEEIRRVDSWVRRNTLEKHGPVRVVKPELVFELAFEQIQLSNRHKSGIAVRFPRIARWRQDKTADQADSLDSVKELLRAYG
jgi:DNA ligase 1